jgi:hypothetical protein
MNEDFSKYKFLIYLMENTTRINVPCDFTERVMSGLNKPSYKFLNILIQVFKETGSISWSTFCRQCIKGYESSFCFLISGLFFFFIGTILLTSIFHLGYLSTTVISIAFPAILIIVAAISLITAGLMVAAHLPSASTYAKGSIMVYGIMIITNTLLINFTFKTTFGAFFPLTFFVTGILMGMVLLRVLKDYAHDSLSYKQGGQCDA